MDDLISRQAAIDAFLTELTKRERKNLLHTWSTTEVKYFVTNMLERLPSAQPEHHTENLLAYAHDMGVTLDQAEKELRVVQPERKPGRWIPVSERQPDVTGLYLVTATVYLDNEPSGYTTSAANWSNGRWLMEGVKAWCPLPDPWEVEND